MTDEQSGGRELIEVHFHGPLPSHIANLRSLHDDFAFAMRCAQAYLSLGALNMDETFRTTVAEGLWTSAVISYRRGFTKGKAHLQRGARRPQIPDSWFQRLDHEYQEAHKEILEIANQQVAHRAGKHEHIKVCALLMPPPLPRALYSSATMMVLRISPSDEQVKQLGTLCQDLINGLLRQIESATEELAAFVKAQNLDDLYEDPTRINRTEQ